MTTTCPLRTCWRIRRCYFPATCKQTPEARPSRHETAKAVVDLVRPLRIDPHDWPELTAAIKAYDDAVAS